MRSKYEVEKNDQQLPFSNLIQLLKSETLEMDESVS